MATPGSPTGPDSATWESAICVLSTRRATFVQFEFRWGGDPDLVVELVLPYPAFREFCAMHRSRMLPPANDAVQLEYERLRHRFETSETLGQTVRAT